MEWMIEPGSQDTTVPGCAVLTAVRHLDNFYVLLGGPPPQDTPTLTKIEVTEPGGGELRWRGQNATGNKHGQLLIATFAPPPDGISHLDVRLDVDGTTALTARLVTRTR